MDICRSFVIALNFKANLLCCNGIESMAVVFNDRKCVPVVGFIHSMLSRYDSHSHVNPGIILTLTLMEYFCTHSNVERSILKD